ncbi:hypothetical protein JT05_08020 [Desulfosporosinus sp. Tol-M]|nr:hypothetical protein JT05_08020 [Desulfosporosinus sp. Tol-M]
MTSDIPCTQGNNQMDNDRFFIIARNITVFIVIGLVIAGVILNSSILRTMSISALGLAQVFGSRVDSEEISKLNRKIGPWLGGLLSVLGICYIIFQISRGHQ